MSTHLGFIGAGNMSGAILEGILHKSLASPADIWLSNRSPAKLERWKELGIHTTLDNVTVAQEVDFLVLGIKPQVFPEVLPQIASYVDGKTVLSIAAGISTAYLKAALPGALVIRAIPNTPLKMGLGATVLAQTDDVPPEAFSYACSLFEAAGRVAVIPETQMDDFIAVSGSSPAFFFRVVAALVSAAEAAGIDPSLSFPMAAQTMAGSAAMLLESGHTAQALIDQVCSPGGTTLAALTAFDDFHFEDMILEASRRCAQRSKELGK